MRHTGYEHQVTNKANTETQDRDVDVAMTSVSIIYRYKKRVDC